MKKRFLAAALAMTALFLNLSARAAPPTLRFPMQCQPGKTCWIVNYMDIDAGSKALDYTCGDSTYDGHDGTDIGLPDRVAMETGVAVLAAAPGRVLRLRDNVEDADPNDDEIKAILQSGKGCGNGVIVDHGEGWQTMYCHMKKGSITVRPGDEVKAGDKLGQVGQSGAAQFPHLHFSVLENGAAIDPFTGQKPSLHCIQNGGQSLWSEQSLSYDPAIPYAAGFNTGVPNFDAIKIDSTPSRVIDAKTSILSFWTAFYNLHNGDAITLSIVGPDGITLAHHSIIQKGHKVRQFYYIGKKFPESVPAGLYKGWVVLQRSQARYKPLTSSTKATVLVR